MINNKNRKLSRQLVPVVFAVIAWAATPTTFAAAIGEPTQPPAPKKPPVQSPPPVAPKKPAATPAPAPAVREPSSAQTRKPEPATTTAKTEAPAKEGVSQRQILIGAGIAAALAALAGGGGSGGGGGGSTPNH